MKLSTNTDRLVEEIKDLNKVLYGNIELSIDVVNETFSTDFSFIEDPVDNMFAIMEGEEVRKLFDYNYDICLLDNLEMSRFETLREIKEYVDEWFRAYCI